MKISTKLSGFKVGMKVIKAELSCGRPSAYLTERTIERIEDGKIYLDGAKGKYVRFPERLYIIKE